MMMIVMNLILFVAVLVLCLNGVQGFPRDLVTSSNENARFRHYLRGNIQRLVPELIQPYKTHRALHDDDLFKDVKFYLYTQNNQDTYQELIFNNESSVKSSNIDFWHPTTVVIHGYTNSITSEVIQIIKNSLLYREEHNVIGVDWGAIADTLIYSNAADSVPQVGQYVGQFLQFLIGTGQSLDSLHIVGHSLGAHIAGLAGRQLTQLMGPDYLVPRITGLDPAKPGFDGADETRRLDKTDAKFVDCIHTCSGELGLGKPVCHADYYPNGADSFQPACPWWDVAGICSHDRSYLYYNESILLSHEFPGSQCQTVPQDITADCTPSKALMGDPATPEFTGYFLVVTNDQYPYSKNIVTSKSTLP